MLRRIKTWLLWPAALLTSGEGASFLPLRCSQLAALVHWAYPVPASLRGGLACALGVQGPPIMAGTGPAPLPLDCGRGKTWRAAQKRAGVKAPWVAPFAGHYRGGLRVICFREYPESVSGWQGTL